MTTLGISVVIDLLFSGSRIFMLVTLSIHIREISSWKYVRNPDMKPPIMIVVKNIMGLFPENKHAVLLIFLALFGSEDVDIFLVKRADV